MFRNFLKWIVARQILESLWRSNTQWYVTPWIRRDSRDSDRYSFLQLLSVAHEQRLELAPLVSSFAEEHRGSYRRLLKSFVNRLESGVTLISALEQTPELLSDDMVLALRFGTQSGTLAAAYRQLLEPEEHPWKELVLEYKHLQAYWLVMAALLLIMVACLQATSGIKLTAMWDEFGLRPPSVFIALRESFQFAVYFLLPAIVGIAVLSFLAPIAWRAQIRRSIASRLFRSLTELRKASLLKLLAMAESAGRPISGSLSSLAKYHFDDNLRQQLLVSRNEVEQGDGVWDSLATVKLISPEQSKTLVGSESPEVRAWALRQWANLKSRLVWQRASIALTVSEIGATILFGLLVLWVCIAYFSFLTTIIYSLS